MSYWGLSQDACLTAAQEPSSGIHYPGFYVLKRRKRVQWLHVEGKHCLTLYVGSEVWGEKPQSSEAGGASRTTEPFLSLPHDSWRVVWSYCSSCVTGARCHFCIALTHSTAQLCSPAVCHRHRAHIPPQEALPLEGSLPYCMHQAGMLYIIRQMLFLRKQGLDYKFTDMLLQD